MAPIPEKVLEVWQLARSLEALDGYAFRADPVRGAPPHDLFQVLEAVGADKVVFAFKCFVTSPALADHTRLS